MIKWFKNEIWRYRPAPWLQVHPQYESHDCAAIVGNRYGLLKLAFIATKAALFGRSSCLLFAFDGEGYDLNIGHVNLQDGEECGLGCPYIWFYDMEGYEITSGDTVSQRLGLNR